MDDWGYPLFQETPIFGGTVLHLKNMIFVFTILEAPIFDP